MRTKQDRGMYNQELIAYMNMLKLTHMGAIASFAEFISTVLENLVDEEASNIITNAGATMVKIANGSRPFGPYAVRIGGQILPDQFKDYLRERKNSTTFSFMAQNYAMAYPDEAALVSPENVVDKCTDKLIEIVQRAAVEEANLAPALTPDTLTAEYGQVLALMEGGKCAYPGCKTLLFLQRGDRYGTNYKVVAIDEFEEKSLNNSIALCPKCAQLYLATADDTDVEMMKMRRQMVSNNNSVDGIIASHDMEDKVAEVIKKLRRATSDEVKQYSLEMKPADVEEKIPDDDMLLDDVERWVAVYYPAIDIEFHNQYDDENELELFERQVKDVYHSIRRYETNKSLIFKKMTEWFVNKTGCEWRPCEAIVAFFVQKCEVFDVPTK